MKLLTCICFFCFLSLGYAEEIYLKDYDFTVSDISSKGLKKEKVFDGLNTSFIKTGKSICSNRALVWAYDLKRFLDINSAKIFLFYTKKTGEVGRKTWWYHVAPMVNENTQLWVIDRGFPDFIDTPLSQQDWLFKFTGSKNCKEIKIGENDLISKMFTPQTFPQTTSYGEYDCYYRIAPEEYWTPASVAMNMLGIDENGNPVRYQPDQINEKELLAACMEASTSKIGRVFSDPEKKCKKYLGL